MIRLYKDATLEELKNLFNELNRHALKCSPHIAALCAQASKQMNQEKLLEASKTLKGIKTDTVKQASAVGVLASGLLKRLTQYRTEMKTAQNISNPFDLDTKETVDEDKAKFDVIKQRFEKVKKSLFESEYLKPNAPQWIEGSEVNKFVDFFRLISRSLTHLVDKELDEIHRKEGEKRSEFMSRIGDAKRRLVEQISELESIVTLYTSGVGKRVNLYNLAENFGIHRTPVSSTPINERVVNKLLNVGGKRWTKAGYDRIYLSPEATLKAAKLTYTDDMLHEVEISDPYESKLRAYREKDFNKIIGRDFFYDVLTGKFNKSGNLIDNVVERILK